MWKDNVNNLLEYYNGGRNRLIECKINGQDLLITKHNAIEILKDSIESELYKISKEILKILDNNLDSSFEARELRELDKAFENYLLEKEYNISIIKENTIFINAMFKNRIFLQQNNHFKNYHISQNNFDNMISILKIIDRLEEQGYTIDYDWFNFDSENDISNTLMEYITYEALKEFGMIRFLI